jgi:hypothetical protein
MHFKKMAKKERHQHYQEKLHFFWVSFTFCIRDR